ncbi:MAG: DUF6491 family protein [Pseudomonadota bacterium]
MKAINIVVPICMVGLAASCATPSNNPAVHDAMASGKISDPRVGDEVSRACFAGGVESWRVIEGDERAVVLSNGESMEYRAEVSADCRTGKFLKADKIGFEFRPAASCLTRGAAIIVDDDGRELSRNARPQQRRSACFVTRLNEWREDAADG